MDYQNGKIYTIRSPHTPKYYIGGTTTTLPKRLSKHKKDRDCRVRELFDLGDAYIELMELFPCNNKMELDKREGELQRLHKADLINYRCEGRTEEQKKEQMKYHNSLEINKQKKREYAESHREEINTKKREARRIKKEQTNLVDIEKK